jgi:hypothetical protein
MTTATMKAMLTKMETMATITMAMTTRPQQQDHDNKTMTMISRRDTTIN